MRALPSLPRAAADGAQLAAVDALVGFTILWSARKHPFRSGWLFALYLLLAGAERLLIECIRVNAVFQVFGVSATQAELVSVIFILMGVVGLVMLSNGGGVLSPRRRAQPKAQEKRLMTGAEHN